MVIANAGNGVVCMNFIDLFNAVVKVAKPAQSEYIEAASLDDSFESLEIDSLDGLVIVMYMCEIYGVCDTDSREWHPLALGELHDLLKAAQTREPASVSDAIGMIK